MSQITVTAKAGPGLTVTSQVLTGVTEVDLQLDRFVMFVTSNGQQFQYDIYATATETATIVTRNWTMVVSQ